MNTIPVETTQDNNSGLRLLYASRRPCFPVFFSGGADRSMHALLHALGGYGVSCRALGATLSDEPASLQPPRPEEYAALDIRSSCGEGRLLRYDVGYPVELGPAEEFEGLLERTIREFAPTVIVTQLHSAGMILEKAYRHRISTVHFFRDTLQQWLSADQIRHAAERQTSFIANCHFVQRQVQETYGVSSSVVYPIVDWRKFKTPRTENGRIAMINPVPPKGILTFLRVAHRLPHRRFLIVDGWPKAKWFQQLLETTLEMLPNVEFIPRTSDIRQVFRRTSLLLVPSIWPEPFPRVVLEAHASGIPVVASDRGGLAHCVGKGGVIVPDYLNPEAWVAAIESIMNDPARMAALSEAASRNVVREEILPDENIQRFLHIVQEAHRRTLRLRATA